MEITQEFKEALFAQYWGVKCLKNKLLNDNIPPHKVDCSNCKGLPQQYLELRSIESITDEEAKELSYKSKQDFTYEHEISMGLYDAIDSDLLRKKGFAIPFRGVSVETMMEQGLIKLAE